MKQLFIRRAILISILGISASAAMAAEVDAWVGRYRAVWPGGSSGTDGELSIVKASKPDRWLLTSPADKRAIELRPFLPGEYEGLHTAGAIECLNGRNVALCRGKPGTTVSFDGGGPVPENFAVRTGYFGVLIQNGAAAFELTKQGSTP